MTEEQLAAIPRRTLDDILAMTPPSQLQAVLESHINIEWWRGYYAGRRALLKELDEVRGMAAAKTFS